MRQQGKLYIDGIDAFIEYGIFIERGSYKEVVQMPSFKKPDATEWDEFDGIEVDLLSPVLDTKQFKIQFCITNVRYAEDFFYDLSTCTYHTFQFVELGKTYKLRMVSNDSFTSLIKLGKLTLTFADDFPAVPSDDYHLIDKSSIRKSGYKIDDIDISNFGFQILKGIDDSVRKLPNTRPSLSINPKNKGGIIYDDGVLRFKEKNITLRLFSLCSNIDEFWHRYDSLFSVLLQSETRMFYFPRLDKEYECYYESSQVQKFKIISMGRVWCELDITLKCISSRPESTYCVLIAEDGSIITPETEDASIIIRKTFK